MKISILLLMFVSSAAVATSLELEFEQSKKDSLAKQAQQKKQAPAQALEDRAQKAAERAGLRPEEFTIQVSRKKAFLRTSDKVCQLVLGQKTLKGLDCGATYPSPWAVLANSCQVDNPEADALECYPIKP